MFYDFIPEIGVCGMNQVPKVFIIDNTSRAEGL